MLWFKAFFSAGEIVRVAQAEFACKDGKGALTGAAVGSRAANKCEKWERSTSRGSKLPTKAGAHVTWLQGASCVLLA